MSKYLPGARRNLCSTVSWVFFAFGAKPTSMRRGIAEKLGEREAVVIVGQPVSLVRNRAFIPLNRRCLRFGKDGNSWHYYPMHFPEKLPIFGPIFKALNEKLIQREIDKLLYPKRERIVCYDSPTQYPLVKKFQEVQSVYLAVDDRTLTVCGNPISGEAEAERHLLGKVDRVICVSEKLAQTLKSRVPQGHTPPIWVLPNGYDERIFDPNVDYPEPAFLKSIPRPRILITGHVSERIDWGGIIRAARLRSQWNWIFVGPADQGVEEKIYINLHVHGHYHPPISVADVPAWVSYCDACAVPYCLNPFTLASHPLKALEYLAMGKPTLSTRIPSLERFDGAIEWVNEGDGESYAAALDEFAKQEEDQELRMFRQLAVTEDSWTFRVDQFRKANLDRIGTRQ